MMEVLSTEVVNTILCYIEDADIENSLLVSKLFNNIIKDDIYWKEKLMVRWGKKNKSNEQTWKDRYIVEKNFGSLSLGPKLHELLNYENNVPLPIKCIYALSYNYNIIYYITEEFNLYQYNIQNNLSTLVDNNVNTTGFFCNGIIYYIKNGHIYLYVEGEKIKVPTVGYVKIIKSSCYKLHAYYINTKGQCYELTKVDGWKSERIEILECKDIIKIYEDFIILTKEGKLFSINNRFDESTKNWINSNYIDKVGQDGGYGVYIILKNKDIYRMSVTSNDNFITSYKIDSCQSKTILHEEKLMANGVYEIQICNSKLLKDIKFYAPYHDRECGMYII
ncbi:F-box domain-containing protein [Orpheovirus IHUMI-LCC2]|uniref:F-box domain-containing protein n=1 Tax=Orpheovirus IHUMI-LCC2 TaxID=2023057 RepID=A0A2I2L3M3_9VIRU|nr:F-box domain-containing protein [Orpheovirus IHUMI-LCC2]SNW62128.1 F-box domain-containing protein [Orpheovirus IHUMI-LCC2]